ncbi:MAG: hypothetical protein KOO60_14225 [Gemmatimonadales bacterium]|nr:hypothetical protein [Gemmatimonadales bacterium]
MKPAQHLIPYFAVLIGLYVFESAWLTILTYHGSILLVVWKEKQLSEFRKLFAGWRAPTCGALLLFGLGGGIILFILGPRIGIQAEPMGSALNKIGLGGSGFLLFVVYHSLINPWLEEVYWRGYLGSGSKKIVPGDLLFAGYHLLVLTMFVEWIWLVVAFLLLSFAAWLWRQIATGHKGLSVPALSHLAADGSIMFAVWRLTGLDY